MRFPYPQCLLSVKICFKTNQAAERTLSKKTISFLKKTQKSYRLNKGIRISSFFKNENYKAYTKRRKKKLKRSSIANFH